MTTVTDVLPTTFHEVMVSELYTKAITLANYRHCKTMEESWLWLAELGFGEETLIKKIEPT